jgi:hypothetical protein
VPCVHAPPCAHRRSLPTSARCPPSAVSCVCPQITVIVKPAWKPVKALTSAVSSAAGRGGGPGGRASPAPSSSVGGVAAEDDAALGSDWQPIRLTAFQEPGYKQAEIAVTEERRGGQLRCVSCAAGCCAGARRAALLLGALLLGLLLAQLACVVSHRAAAKKKGRRKKKSPIETMYRWAPARLGLCAALQPATWAAASLGALCSSRASHRRCCTVVTGSGAAAAASWLPSAAVPPAAAAVLTQALLAPQGRRVPPVLGHGAGTGRQVGLAAARHLLAATNAPAWPSARRGRLCLLSLPPPHSLGRRCWPEEDEDLVAAFCSLVHHVTGTPPALLRL